MFDLSTITASDILSVYSGLDGACCCGCKGKHSYNSARKAEAGNDRGYAVSDEDCNDRMIAKVLKLMQAAAPLNDVEENGSDRCLSTVVGKRVYIIYMPSGKATPHSGNTYFVEF